MKGAGKRDDKRRVQDFQVEGSRDERRETRNERETSERAGEGRCDDDDFFKHTELYELYCTSGKYPMRIRTKTVDIVPTFHGSMAAWQHGHRIRNGDTD